MWRRRTLRIFLHGTQAVSKEPNRPTTRCFMRGQGAITGLPISQRWTMTMTPNLDQTVTATTSVVVSGPAPRRVAGATATRPAQACQCRCSTSRCGAQGGMPCPQVSPRSAAGAGPQGPSRPETVSETTTCQNRGPLNLQGGAGKVRCILRRFTAVDVRRGNTAVRGQAEGRKRNEEGHPEQPETLRYRQREGAARAAVMRGPAPGPWARCLMRKPAQRQSRS